VEKPKSKFRENLEVVVVAILLALFIRTFVVQAFKIPSGSMIPTLLVGDHILVNKFIYGLKIPLIDKKLFTFHQPTRGEVIVFIFPLERSKDFIKRVIGVPGDLIVMKGKRVFINGEPYSDPHAHYLDEDSPAGAFYRADFGPISVPEGSLFVMGDNRDNSKDSRSWGFVPLELVRGKAFMIYWSNGTPYNRAVWNLPMKLLDVVIYNRWSRVGDIIR